MKIEETKVAELRKKIIEKHNIDPKIVSNIKGKLNLVNFLLDLEKDHNMNEEFNITDEEVLKTDSGLTRISKGWTQYILSQLEDDEKDQEYPKTCGLGRLLEQEIASIIEIQTLVIQSPSPTNNMTATVRTTIQLNNGEKYDACADAQKCYLEHPYDKHVTAIAETRSEGRAYRRALRLKGVVTKEEMIEKKEEQEDKINKSQVMLIENMCMNERLNINVHKLTKLLFGEESRVNIYDYTHEQAATINRQLIEYQKDLSKIPTEIKGFDPSWK